MLTRDTGGACGSAPYASAAQKASKIVRRRPELLTTCNKYTAAFPSALPQNPERKRGDTGLIRGLPGALPPPYARKESRPASSGNHRQSERTRSRDRLARSKRAPVFDRRRCHGTSSAAAPHSPSLASARIPHRATSPPPDIPRPARFCATTSTARAPPPLY